MVMFSKIASFAKEELGASVSSHKTDFEVTGVSALASWNDGFIAFCKDVDIAVLTKAKDRECAALIIPIDAEVPGCPNIRTENPRYCFAKIVAKFFVEKPAPGVHATAYVDPRSFVESTATVGPYCTIGPNVAIGARTVLHNHVAVAQNVEIGEDCVLWSHCVIGEDGFGVEADKVGNLIRIPHIGGVKIGNRVHIGNFTSVVGGTLDPTVIEDGAMIDNLVHIAHNAWIGENCQIIACAEISGSVKIGRNAWIAPNASIIQKVEIGENSIIGIGAAVTQSIPANVIAAGVPAKVIRNLQKAVKDE